MSKSSSTSVRLSKAKIAKRKAQLKRLHKDYSWRRMAREIFNGKIKFGTLERFVTDPDYVPKEKELLCVLDLLPSPRRMTPRHMSNNDAAQSWTLWMRELVKSLRTPTPKELAKSLKPTRNRIGTFEDGKVTG